MPCGESGLVSGSVSAWFGVVASGRFLLSMAPAKRRCLGCRKSFTPDRRTATRQTMCSRGCGAKHRRTQSKVRREADVVGFREDDLVDPRTGVLLAQLLPLDKARNAEGIRRALPPSRAPEPRTPSGVAPLLRSLLADYAATGFPPAYLPRGEDETTTKKSEKTETS